VLQDITEEVVTVQDGTGLVVLDLDDGRVVWRVDGAYQPVIAGDTIYLAE